MNISLDIAAEAMNMKAAETAYSASIATMKKTMESMEDISSMLAQQLMNLNVGPAVQSAVDISI